MGTNSKYVNHIWVEKLNISQDTVTKTPKCLRSVSEPEGILGNSSYPKGEIMAAL